MDTTDKVPTRSEYSEKWQWRFDFFDTHGAPSSPGFKPALKQLKGRQGIKINFNFIAFFFGPIYLFVLGLWKKNLVLIGILIALNVALEILYSTSDLAYAYAKQLNFAVGFSMNMIYSFTTNYAYYLKEIKGEQGWNPFKGMRW
jgi:hypothetical protein